MTKHSIIAAGHSDPGKRYHGLNQDAFIITLHDSIPFNLWGIFDGHNMLGEVAAQKSVTEFVNYFRAEFDQQGIDDWRKKLITEEVITNAFHYVHNKILQEHTYPGKEGVTYTLESGEDGNQFYSFGLEKRIIDFGTTAAIAILFGNQLYIGDVGDSRIAIGREERGSLQGEFLTVLHSLDDPMEVHRIRNCCPNAQFRDGFVTYMDVKNHCCTQLAMTRALGHWVFSKLGVIPDPHYCTLTITKRDVCLILASDGVWDYVSESEAVNFVMDFDDPKEAAEELVRHALKLSEMDGRPPDNATAVVVFF